jgi:hypothetical protein
VTRIDCAVAGIGNLQAERRCGDVEIVESEAACNDGAEGQYFNAAIGNNYGFKGLG